MACLSTLALAGSSGWRETINTSCCGGGRGAVCVGGGGGALVEEAALSAANLEVAATWHMRWEGVRGERRWEGTGGEERRWDAPISSYGKESI
jgi:hypothetical protein